PAPGRAPHLPRHRHLQIRHAQGRTAVVPRRAGNDVRAAQAAGFAGNRRDYRLAHRAAHQYGQQRGIYRAGFALALCRRGSRVAGIDVLGVEAKVAWTFRGGGGARVRNSMQFAVALFFLVVLAMITLMGGDTAEHSAVGGPEADVSLFGDSTASADLFAAPAPTATSGMDSGELIDAADALAGDESGTPEAADE